MKPIYTILFLLILNSFSGCEKATRPSEKVVAGKFDWEDSQSHQPNSFNNEPLYTYAPGNVGKNYGLRIQKNRKIYFYENGELIYEEKIDRYKSYGSYDEQSVSFTVYHNNDTIKFSYTDHWIYSHDWPYKNFWNRFKDLKKS